jgi:hypothetical protein
VTNQRALILTKSRSDTRDVSRECTNGVVGDGGRPITAAETALIGHRHLKPYWGVR